MTKTEIIGTPIKIGNLEVDHYDFPEEMDWNTAIKSCLNLGDGRRLPTKEELNILFKQTSKLVIITLCLRVWLCAIFKITRLLKTIM